VESPRRDPSGPQPLKLTDKEKKRIGDLLFGVSRIQQRGVILIADQKVRPEQCLSFSVFHSGLLKRIVRSSLAAEVSQ
ncbi:unnamed protein product, partial [Cladocopium goreaui]